MKTFSSVAQMKLAFLTAGQLIETSGYYAAGDGGQARYLVKVNESIDNLGNHDLADTNVAVLQLTSSINVKQFGARGDGVIDDTASFNAAETASNPALVLVPVASYEIAGVVTGNFYSFGLVTIVTGTVNTIVNLSAAASSTVQGIVELATQAEVDAGTDAVRAVTPATLVSYIDPNKKVKTSSEFKSSDTTLADDSHFSGWALTAGKLYSIEAFIDISQNIGDLKFGFQFSNTPQQSSMLIYAQDETGTIFEDFVTDITLQDVITTMVDGDRYGLKLKGQFSANASVGGTVDFQWAQNTSHSNFTALFFGSWMHIKQLDS